MAYQTVPADSDRAVTRSTTSGFQKPTTPHDRHERKLAKLHAWVETQSCREIANTEWTRGELACCHCLAWQYYLPRAKQNFTSEELRGLLVGSMAPRGYSREKVLSFMVDKAGTRNKSCSRLQQSREQFAILESLRKRTEKVYWQKVQRGEGN